MSGEDVLGECGVHLFIEARCDFLGQGVFDGGFAVIVEQSKTRGRIYISRKPVVGRCLGEDVLCQILDLIYHPLLE